MDVIQLPLDIKSMLAGLRPWIECESPTYDPAAVNRMMTLAAADLTAMGATVERIVAPSAGLGDCLRAAFPHPTPDAPGVLIMGHLDTVHPIGTLEALPFRIEDGRCTGPGIHDMKGGTFAALEAVKALRAVGADTPLPIHVLLTCDEEIGSPGTRALIEAEARKHRAVLIPEPGTPENGVVTGRYAIARYHLTAHGRPSHAGISPGAGHSAIRAMARKVVEIEDMSDDDCTFSVGVIHGGQWVNCVTTTCRAEALSMAKRQADLDQGIARMRALAHRDADGTGFSVDLSVVRPVWEADAGTMALYETARRVAATLGVDLAQGSQGGGCDGNFTGALGIPTLSGLGLMGAGFHTLTEHIIIDSLPVRTRLIAGLLTEIQAP